jgi:RNA polymerase sigma-70 factor, ECF subfamily
MSKSPEVEGAGGEADERSFGQLVAAARGGDPEALSLLIHQCRDYLLLIANQDLDQSLRSKLGASDIVQQTLLAAFENFHQFRGQSEDELSGWLKQILRNDISNARRHYQQTQQRDARREHRLDDSQLIQPAIADPLHTPGTNALINEQEQLLERAMLQLPENYRQVIRLRNWEELGFEKIGQQLQISAEAARKIWSRAIARLAGILEAHEASEREDATFPHDA